MPLIETGPEAPGGRQRKSNGVVQAFMMILAWVGGAGAAIVAAYFILQYVNPRPETVQNDVNRTVVESVAERKKVAQTPKRKIVKRVLDRKSPSVERKEKERPKVDHRNLQRPAMPGVVYQFCDVKPNRIQDINNLTVRRVGVLLNRGDLPQQNKFNGLRLVGFWKTKTEQAFEFTLDSANSGRLWIDGQLVLDNTTLYEPGPVKGTRTIQSGVHKVQIASVSAMQKRSDRLGGFQLHVAAAGSSNRKDLDQLLQPFDSRTFNYSNSHRYALAKYPARKMASVVLPSRRLVVGLAICAQPDGRVAGVKPVYVDEIGLSTGFTYGKDLDDWATVVAKPGYAVSDVRVEKGDLAADVRLEFMKIGKQSLTQAGAYSENIAGDQRLVKIDTVKWPVIDLQNTLLRGSRSFPVRPLRSNALVAQSSPSESENESVSLKEKTNSGQLTDQSYQMVVYLVKGFPAPEGQKPTPRPSIVSKGLKKRAWESNERLAGKKGSELQRELKALANSIETEARNNSVDSAVQFVALLEARRLHVVAGDFKAACQVGHVLMKEFEYDHWKDLLALFEDMTDRAGESSTLQKKVCEQLGLAIFEAQEKFEFEVAGKFALGGKVLADRLKDEAQAKDYQQQVDKLKQLAQITKQARAAAKMLVDKPDDIKANRSMAVFFLRVSEDWDSAMHYFARSGSKDCEFIAEHDRNFTGADAETTAKLAECWKRVAKKISTLEDVAYKRAREILEGAQ